MVEAALIRLENLRALGHTQATINRTIATMEPASSGFFTPVGFPLRVIFTKQNHLVLTKNTVRFLITSLAHKQGEGG